MFWLIHHQLGILSLLILGIIMALTSKIMERVRDGNLSSWLFLFQTMQTSREPFMLDGQKMKMGWYILNITQKISWWGHHTHLAYPYKRFVRLSPDEGEWISVAYKIPTNAVPEKFHYWVHNSHSRHGEIILSVILFLFVKREMTYLMYTRMYFSKCISKIHLLLSI